MTDRRDPSPLHVALPWWDEAVREQHDAGGESPRAAYAWLRSRAAREAPGPASWREWLLAATPLAPGSLGRCAAGPCLQALAGPDGAAPVACAVAQPVHFATAIDHLRLAPLHDLALEADESEALRCALNLHLAGEGLRLEPGPAGAWIVHGARHACTSCDPLAAVGRDVRDHLPEGPEGREVRRLMNECQMLLHEHPVNLARARAGRSPINAVWLWGFGGPAPARALALPPLATDDPWLAGLWRLHGNRAELLATAPRVPDALPAGGLLALARPVAGALAEALCAADARVMQPLRSGVRDGRLRSLALHTGERTIALDAWSRLRFWRRAGALERRP